MRTLAQLGLAVAAIGLALAAANWCTALIAPAYELVFYIAVFALCQVGGGLLLCAALVESEHRRRDRARFLVALPRRSPHPRSRA